MIPRATQVLIFQLLLSPCSVLRTRLVVDVYITELLENFKLPASLTSGSKNYETTQPSLCDANFRLISSAIKFMIDEPNYLNAPSSVENLGEMDEKDHYVHLNSVF
jgi:hypothetical protein